MTAQISDAYIIDGKKYSIVALSKPIGVDPEDYGLEAHASCTACWRGYWCGYAVENEELIMKRLFLYNAEGKYQDFNGVQVSPASKDVDAYFGHREYKTNMKMNYTGKIVLGADFIDKYYIHMGFQRAWAYEKLIELVFRDGKLIEKIDHSDYAKELRKLIDKDPDAFWKELHDDIPAFVDSSFSLDMKEKAWWVDPMYEPEE